MHPLFIFVSGVSINAIHIGNNSVSLNDLEEVAWLKSMFLKPKRDPDQDPVEVLEIPEPAELVKENPEPGPALPLEPGSEV